MIGPIERYLQRSKEIVPDQIFDVMYTRTTYMTLPISGVKSRDKVEDAKTKKTSQKIFTASLSTRRTPCFFGMSR